MAAFDTAIDASVANDAREKLDNFVMATSHEEMNPRRRNTMEDVHRIVPRLRGSPEYSYFGVYDGHGGRQIAGEYNKHMLSVSFKCIQCVHAYCHS